MKQSRVHFGILLVGVIMVLALVWGAYRWSAYSHNALVIVEPREHPLLKYVIDNFDKRMDSSWDLYVFHGASMRKYAETATEDVKKRGKRRIFLISLDTDNLKPDEYNDLFKKTSFWDQVWAENILVFQTDTAICSASPYKIGDFMKYDYIGCAGGKSEIGKDAYWGGTFYGVGGLSFRKKSFMQKCIAERPAVAKGYAEDVFFSECVEAFGVKPESADVLNAFCTQNESHALSFGAHKTRNLKGGDKKTFYKYCPAAQALEVA